MWLGIKQAAGKPKPPVDRLLVAELGVQDAIRYRRLLDRFPADEAPEAQRGPDETISDHYSRLNKRLTEERAQYEKEQGTRPKAAPVSNRETPTPEWLLQRQREQEAPAPQSSPSDLKGMPQRIPGWFTGDAMDAPPPGYGKPPSGLPRRDPGAALDPSQQSMDEWHRWLADKGIVLDDQGRAVDPPGPLPQRKPTRRPPEQHWQEFVNDPVEDQHLRDLPENQGGFGKSWRQRAKSLFGLSSHSAVVAEYARRVLAEDSDAISQFYRRHNAMTGTGWDFHESGSGNWYEKNIDGKTHRIMGDSMSGQNGWTHHADGETPAFYHDIKDALLHAHRGQMQAGFSAKPPSIQRLNSRGR